MRLRHKLDSYLAERVFKALSEILESKGWTGLNPCRRTQKYAKKYISYDTPYEFYFYPDHLEVVEKGETLDSASYEDVYIIDGYLETSEVKLSKGTWAIKKDNF